MTYALVILSWSNTENTKAKAKQREMYFNIYFGGDRKLSVNSSLPIKFITAVANSEWQQNFHMP